MPTAPVNEFVAFRNCQTTIRVTVEYPRELPAAYNFRALAARIVAPFVSAKAALEAEALDRAKVTGKDAEQAEPEAKAQRNFTDPDIRITPSSDKTFVHAYSAQAAVDAEHQVIVAADVVQTTGSDGAQLLPMVHQEVDDLALTPEVVSADAGYWREGSDIATLDD